MAISAYLRDKLLDHVFKGTAFTQPTNVYMSLHTADPGTTGTSEVTGGSYARQSVNTSFAASASGSKSSNAAVAFAGMPAATVTYAGFWDASTAGNFLWGEILTASKTTAANDTLNFASGQITTTLT